MSVVGRPPAELVRVPLRPIYFHYAWILVAIASGPVFNLLSVPVTVRTALIDLLLGGVVLVCVVRRGMRIEYLPSTLGLLWLLAAYAVALAAHSVLVPFEFGAQAATYRLIAIYPILVLLTVSQGMCERRVERAAGFLLLCFGVVAGFALVQFFGSAVLPRSLLVLEGEETFGFFGRDVVRPTGMIGNTIVFSGFLLLGVALAVSRYLLRRDTSSLAVLLLILSANVVAFSRASLLAALGICGVVYVLHRGMRVRTILMLGVFSGLLLIAFVGLLSSTFLYARLVNIDPSTQASTATHIREWLAALESIAAYPLSGIGLGSQGPSFGGEKIITDGFWFQLAVEQGLPLAAFYLLCYLLPPLLVLAERRRVGGDRNPFLLAFPAVAGAFFFVNLLNSSYYSQINHLLYWLMFSLAVAGRRQPADWGDR